MTCVAQGIADAVHDGMATKADIARLEGKIEADVRELKIANRFIGGMVLLLLAISLKDALI